MATGFATANGGLSYTKAGFGSTATAQTAIQALVFALLSTIYISLMLPHEESHP